MLIGVNTYWFVILLLLLSVTEHLYARNFAQQQQQQQPSTQQTCGSTSSSSAAASIETSLFSQEDASYLRARQEFLSDYHHVFSSYHHESPSVTPLSDDGPEHPFNTRIEEIVRDDLERMKGEVYLDYTGSGVYRDSQLKKVFEVCVVVVVVVDDDVDDDDDDDC